LLNHVMHMKPPMVSFLSNFSFTYVKQRRPTAIEKKNFAKNLNLGFYSKAGHFFTCCFQFKKK
jgi:sulfur relay (sulfurtransferase) DsrF/TusC family protein